MAELLAPDGGRLVCLEWPSHKPTSESGPPWGVRPEAYAAHLRHPGVDLPYGAHDGALQDVGGDLGPPSAAGLKRLAHLTPTETHRTGMYEDGTVHDRVSVWGH